MVGRDAELSRIRRALAAASFVVVHGGFGVGRSSVARHIAAEYPTAFVGQALPSMRQRAYHPVLHALGWPPRADEPTAMAKLVIDHLPEDALLVLDDLQWADQDTLEVLVEVRARRTVLVTVQDGESDSDKVLRLCESLGGTSVRLDLLDDASMQELLSNLRPDLLRGERDRIVGRAAGNPLVATMLAAHSDVMAGNDPIPDGPPLVTAFLDRLSMPALELLALLSQAARPVDPAELPPELAAGAPSLIGSGMATADDGGRIAAGNPLMAIAAYDALPAERRRGVDIVAAASDLVAPLRRAELLSAAGEHEAALDVALRAAVAPVPRFEQAAAMAVAVRASSAARAAGATGALDHEQLVVETATALNDSGRFEDASVLLDDPSIFDSPWRASAAVEALRSAIGHGKRHYVDRVLENIDDWMLDATEAQNAHAAQLLNMTRGWELRDAPQEHLAAVARSVEAATSSRERSRAATLVGLAAYSVDVAAMASWFAEAKQAALSGDALGDELSAARNLAIIQIGMGQQDAGRAVVAESIAKAEAAGELTWVLEFRTLDFLSRFYDGIDHDEALSWMSYVRTAPVRLETKALATASLSLLLADRGDVERSAAVIKPWVSPEVLETFDPLVQAVLMWGVCQGAWVLGDLATVVDRARWVTDAVPTGFPSLAGTQVSWRWAEYELGVPITAPDPVGGFADAALREATAIGDLAAADADGEPGSYVGISEQFIAAGESWRPFLLRCTLRCRWAAGVAATRAGDRAGAIALLEEVDTELDRAGMASLRPRVQAALRVAKGAASAQRTASVESTTASDLPISPREREVLEHVRSGLTSRETALRLGLSTETVNSHVRSAMRKLGVRTRAEAVSVLGRV